jgi:hypothetical protein
MTDYSDKTALSQSSLTHAQNSCSNQYLRTSSNFSQTLMANDRELKIIGQPWQNSEELNLNIRMSVIHCGALHSRELFDKGGFDTSFRIVGDYEFLYRQRERLGAVFVEEPLVTARAGGLSTRSDLAVIQKLEVKRLFKIHRAGVFANLYWYLGMCATLASLAPWSAFEI